MRRRQRVYVHAAHQVLDGSILGRLLGYLQIFGFHYSLTSRVLMPPV
jgi:hypothetical protein